MAASQSQKPQTFTVDDILGSLDDDPLVDDDIAAALASPPHVAPRAAAHEAHRSAVGQQTLDKLLGGSSSNALDHDDNDVAMAQQHNASSAMLEQMRQQLLGAEMQQAVTAQALQSATDRLRAADEEIASLSVEVAALRSAQTRKAIEVAPGASVSRVLRLDSASPLRPDAATNLSGGDTLSASTVRRATFRERQRCLVAGVAASPTPTTVQTLLATAAVPVGALQRLAAVESARRQSIAVAAFEELAQAAVAVALSFYRAAATEATGAHLATVGVTGNTSMALPTLIVQAQSTAVFSSFATEAVDAVAREWACVMEDRFASLEDALEAKLATLMLSAPHSAALAHGASAAGKPPLPPPALSGVVPMSRHRRTASQHSDAGSSLGASFADGAAAAIGGLDTSTLHVQVSGSGPAPLPSPRLSASRPRHSSFIRRGSISLSAGEAALLVSAMSPTANSPATAAPPPKGADRPEVHRKLLLAGRVSASPTHSGAAPIIRVDDVTAESAKWTANDFGDYAQFTAHNIFLLGAHGSGKTSVAYCLSNKAPTFIKRAPKVDTPTMAPRFVRCGVRNLKVPDTIPLGGFDDQHVDAKLLMKMGGTAKSGGSGYCVQSSAVARLVDIPLPVLELGCAPGALPARGALYCLCFPMHGDPAAWRADLARVIRHVVATTAGSAFPMPAIAVDGAAARLDAAAAKVRPTQISFVLIGTHVDKLSKKAADETAIQAALREEREWVLRLLEQLGCPPQAPQTRAAGDVDRSSSFAAPPVSAMAQPPVQANLVDCYAVSCAAWTVMGERAKTASNFQELLEQLCLWSAVHSPAAPEHIAATTIRHFAAALIDENAEFASSSASGGSVALEAVAAAALRIEVARCAMVPLRLPAAVTPLAAATSPVTAATTWVANNGVAPTTVEQGFPMLHQCFTARRAAIVREQQSETSSTGSGPRSESTTPRASARFGGASPADTGEALFGAVGTDQSFSAFAPPVLRYVNFSADELPDEYRDAAKYLISSFAFGLVTLCTALQRWVDYAGSVIDGVIFQGLVMQHLHVKSVVGKLVSVAISVTRQSNPDVASVIADSATKQLQEALVAALSKRVVASLLATGRARGWFSMVDTVPAVGCNAVLLGMTLPWHLQAMTSLPVRAFRQAGCPVLAAAAGKEDRVLELFAAAARDGVTLHEDYVKGLMRAAAELSVTPAATAADSRLGTTAGRGTSNTSPATVTANLNWELLSSGYLTAAMTAAIVPPQLDVLTIAGVSALALGPHVAALTRPLPDAFLDRQRVVLPTAGSVLCSSGKDLVLYSLAGEVGKGVAAFIALAMASTAESPSAMLIGNMSISVAPMAFASRFAAGIASLFAEYLLDFRVWGNAVFASLSSKKIAIAGGAAQQQGMPPGACAMHAYVHFSDDGHRVKARVCVVCVDSKPSTAAPAASSTLKSQSSAAVFSKYVIGGVATPAHGPAAAPGAGPLSEDSSLTLDDDDAELFHDVTSFFEVVVRGTAEDEALAYGRSLSAVLFLNRSTDGVVPHDGDGQELAPEESSNRRSLCRVTADFSVGGPPPQPWEAIAPRAREMLLGLPRPAVDSAVNALRRMVERSTTDLSFRALLDPLVATVA